MGKHTQNCTLIGKGVYGTIGVDQRSRLADGAHFHTMIVTSTLEASVIEGDKLVIKSGIVRCDGDIRVSSISGSGDIEVGGDIICDEITFTGKLRCNGDIVCSGNLSVNGSLGTRHISGQTVRLNGVLKGHDVNSRALEVHPLRSTMFSRFDMDGYEDGSTVRHITAVTVEANHLWPKAVKSSIGIIVHLNNIVSFRFLQRNNLIMLVQRYDYTDFKTMISATL